MTPEQATIYAGVIQAVATIVVGVGIFLAGLWFGRRQHATKQLMEYEVSSTSLLPSNMRSPLSVSISKEIISGDPVDHGNSMPVERAYAFFVTAYNTGSETLTQPTIEITLDDGAAIVQTETEPPSKPQYVVVTNRDTSKANIIRITPAYINSKENIKITTVSVQNKTPDCTVTVLGAGIKLRPYQSSNPITDIQKLILSAFGLITLTGGILFIVSYLVQFFQWLLVNVFKT